MNKLTRALVAASAAALALTGCTPESETVDHNITNSADNFEVNRRIVVINGITDAYLFTVEGRCSITDQGNQLEVLCKVDDCDEAQCYKKHLFGLSDNTTYIVEQLTGLNTDPFHHEINFRPEAVIPDIDLQTSGG